MKVRYLLNGIEKEGEATKLSTLGAFVQTQEPAQDGPINILLEAGQGNISVAARVVDSSEQGFSVAFYALDLPTLDRLLAALGIQQPSDTKSAMENFEAGKEQQEMMEVQGKQWVPPVTEPPVHEWKPQGELHTPPPEKAQEHSADSLPTLTPAPNSTAGQVKAKAAADPSQEALADKPADKRQATRHDMSIPVTFDNLTGLIKEFTHNISYGGMFVYTTEPMKENSDIAVSLIHPVHGQRLTLLAKVVHASNAPNPDPVTGQARYGLGIEFRLPLDELKRVLSDFIGSHQNQGAEMQASSVVNEARSRLELASQSPYSLLGLDDGADQDQIRQAYFRLVDRFHPDRYFGKITGKDRKILEEFFRSLTKAYEELTA